MTDEEAIWKMNEAQLEAGHSLTTRDWSDLAELPESETHRLEIDVKGRNGWIYDKRDPEAFGHYLSTHTFYGMKHKYSTRLLKRCGFNVVCANWDEASPDAER